MKSKNILILQIIALSFIFSFYSCNSDEKTGNQDDSFNFEDYISLTDPDKVIENESGTLCYYKELNTWAISVYIPATIDCMDIYFVVGIHDVKFLFEEGKDVSISGFCYRIPRSILSDNGIVYPAGVECYCIKVTDLN